MNRLLSNSSQKELGHFHGPTDADGYDEWTI